MRKPALQLVGAALGQASTTHPALLAVPDDVSPETREARRLAELAASFALFGLRIYHPDWAREWSAELTYRTDAPAAKAPTNDVFARSFAFPPLESRGVHIDPRHPIRMIQVIDWVVAALAANLAALWGAGAGLADLALGQAFAFVLSALSLKAGLWLTETYRVTPARMRPEHGVGGLAIGVMLGLLLANVLAPDARAAAALTAILPLAAILLACLHGAMAVWIRAAHRAGVFAETVVLVGATEAGERLAQRAARSGEARVVAVVDDRLARVPGALGEAPVCGNVEDLLAWEGLPHVDRIIITVTQKAEARVRDIIARLSVIPNRVDLLLACETQSVSGRRVERLGAAAVACVSGRPHCARRAMAKRALDIVGAVILLAAFALPMLLIAAAIRCESRGPALYRQRRRGFNNRVFTILKFRTMRHEPGAVWRQARQNDRRLTGIGRWLRAAGLDELPQLFNVLAGEMSLVGPRPHAVGMTVGKRALGNISAEYARRHRVKPGITGWAQVNGSRGAVESASALRRRIKLDLDYLSRASLCLDLQILLRTIPTVLGLAGKAQ